MAAGEDYLPFKHMMSYYSDTNGVLAQHIHTREVVERGFMVLLFLTKINFLYFQSVVWEYSKSPSRAIFLLPAATEFVKTNEDRIN